MTDDTASDRPEFGDYPAGTEVFSAKFDADDFEDPMFTNGREYPDGAVITIRRGRPLPKGWILEHAELSDAMLTKTVMRMYADDDAYLAIISLVDDAFDEFFEAWDKDGGVTPGKSPRSTRRSKRTKRR